MLSRDLVSSQRNKVPSSSTRLSTSKLNPAPSNANPTTSRANPSTSASRSGYPSLMRASTMKSSYTNPRDITMAERQTRYSTLTRPEKVQQEEWAQTKITQLGPCPAGYEWTRHAHGYRCNGGHHYITDDVIVQGGPAYYHMFRKNTEIDDVIEDGLEFIPDAGFWWVGPFYVSPEDHRRNQKRNVENYYLKPQQEPRPTGPGGRAPNSQDMSKSHPTLKWLWDQGKITFPKGRTCSRDPNHNSGAYQSYYIYGLFYDPWGWASCGQNQSTYSTNYNYASGI